MPSSLDADWVPVAERTASAVLLLVAVCTADIARAAVAAGIVSVA